MGIYAYAKQILKADFKYTLNYLIAISVLTLFVFNGLNVALNTAILNTTGTIELFSDGQVYNIPVDIIQKEKIVWLIIVVILFSAFCNNYFVSRKTKEVGFAIVNGSSIYDVSKFLLFQNGVLFLLASIIGVIIGLITMPLFNSLIYNLTGKDGNIFYLSSEAILYTFLIIGIQCLYFVVFNLGYVYRKEIVELLKEKSIVQRKDERTIKIPPVVYFVVYFIPMIYILFAKEIKGVEFAYNTISIFSVFGAIGIVKYGMPWIMNLYKRSGAMFNSHKIVYISNFVYSLSRSSIYFFAICISFWYFSYDMIKYSDIDGMQEIATFILLCIFVVVSIALMYKISCECEEKSSSYLSLIKLGYSKDDVKSIIGKEIVMFYLGGLSFPLGFVLISVYGYLKVSAIPMNIGILLISVLVIPVLITGITSYVSYKKNIMKFIEEGR